MASKSTIPRFLLPRYGAMWRTTTRTASFPRRLNTDLAQLSVRYASKTTTAASKTATAAVKVKAPKAASTKAAAPKAPPKASSAKAPSTTTKVAAASTRVSLPKTAPTKTSTIKSPAASKVATPKTPTSQPVTQAAAAVSSHTTPATEATSTTPEPVADPSSKPIVLEKPEKFNPPSHGSRLPRATPRHYGGSPTVEEVQAQKTKEYPGLPPPETSWSHWFLNNKNIHMFITLGTLTGLALFTFGAKFKATSPFADMIPPISEFPRHPIDYIGTCLHVLRLHEEHESSITAEKRRRRVDDVAKRNEYRKAHGLDSAQGLESWNGASQQQQQLQESASPALAADEVAVPELAPAVDGPAADASGDGKRKKLFGIF